jgi:hypothetical protein
VKAMRIAPFGWCRFSRQEISQVKVGSTIKIDSTGPIGFDSPVRIRLNSASARLCGLAFFAE